MKIGITYNLKAPGLDPSLPDDAQEEFDSPHTIDAIAAVIAGMGHRVVLLGDGEEFLRKVLADRPDFVFNFAEGTGVSRSREARVPAVLEMLGIPFTGSDPLTMAVTLDKDCAKRLVHSAGVAVPASVVLRPAESASPLAASPLPPSRSSGERETLGERESLGQAARLTYPVIVKPAWEGSSKGIRQRCLVHGATDLPDVLAGLWRDHRQPMLVEEYIQGDEVTVGIYGNEQPRLLGIMRVLPQFPVENFIYSLEIKRDYKKLVKYECPPAMDERVLAAIREASLACYRALGCRDISRVDFRVRGGVPYFLEVNPLPGLNPDDSDLVIMAGLVGWSYERLVTTIVNAALDRHGLR